MTATAAPLFSIVTVARNALVDLQATYESIRSQGGLNSLEWIVIDGASTDGTVDFMAGLQALFPLDFRSEPDTGIFNAMNKGLAKARGDYVLFLNAGDRLAAPDTLACVAACVQSAQPALLYGDSIQQVQGVQTPAKAARQASEISFGMFACHQAVYYRRAAAVDLRYREDLQCAGDYAFTAEFLRRHPEALHLDRPLCIFDTSGISNSNEALGRRENWLVQRDILKLGLSRRVLNQLRYLAAAVLRKHLTGVYRSLRFQRA